MVVQHSGQKIVRSSDSVEIAGKVKVNVLHRHYLGITAACSAALHAEYRSQRRLSEGHNYIFPQLLHSICQAYGSRSLSLPSRSRSNGCHKNQLSIGAAVLVQQVIVYLCLVLSILFQILFVNTQRGCYLCDM